MFNNVPNIAKLFHSVLAPDSECFANEQCSDCVEYIRLIIKPLKKRHLFSAVDSIVTCR